MSIAAVEVSQIGRRPTRSTRQAPAIEAIQFQTDRPPLMAAIWAESVMPTVRRTGAR